LVLARAQRVADVLVHQRLLLLLLLLVVVAVDLALQRGRAKCR
jgi:hypothetical protein